MSDLVPQQSSPTDAQVSEFLIIQPMIAEARKEMVELSKKKQDGILNELKVRHINRLLTKANEVLGTDPSLAFVELLDEETLPQNSDAVIVLGQWLEAMRQFKGRHHGNDPADPYHSRWFTQENPRSDQYDDDEYDEDEDEDEDE